MNTIIKPWKTQISKRWSDLFGRQKGEKGKSDADDYDDSHAIDQDDSDEFHISIVYKCDE